MKKDIFIHLFSILIFLFLVSLAHGWLPSSLESILVYLPLWIGGIIGTFLPDVDQLIYVYFLRPTDLTSQRVNQMNSSGDFKNSASLLYSTRTERSFLVFHTVLFQVVFYILSFLVVSSSSSFLGRGLVLGFLLHLFIDQIKDLRSYGNINNWFRNLPVTLDRDRTRIFIASEGLLILVFAFLF